MSPVFAAALFAMFLWWFATGTIFYLIGRAARTYRFSLMAASGLAAAALLAIFLIRGETGQAGAYIGFSAAIVLWGWHEISFLTGKLTGPRRTACAPDCSGLPHLRHGIEALIHHEGAILANAALLVVLCWDAANATALHVFLILWVMRISAKLNLHLGVPNTAAELLPPHLAYLRSFFRVRAINPLFPVSIAFATALTIWLAMAAGAAVPGSGAEAAYALMATLSALALAEHILLVLPLPAETLWRWALGDRAGLARETREEDGHKMLPDIENAKPVERRKSDKPGLEIAAQPPFRATAGLTVKGG